jgi:hypothetical protein
MSSAKAIIALSVQNTASLFIFLDKMASAINYIYKVLVTFDSERGASGFKPLAAARRAAKSWPGMM